MAHISTLIYVLDEERNELIDFNEVFELENSTYRKFTRKLDLIEFNVRPEIISNILQHTGRSE